MTIDTALRAGGETYSPSGANPGDGDHEDDNEEAAPGRAEQDLVAAFVDDCCTVGPNAKALTADLYRRKTLVVRHRPEGAANHGFRYKLSTRVWRKWRNFPVTPGNRLTGDYRNMRHYHPITGGRGKFGQLALWVCQLTSRSLSLTGGTASVESVP